MENLNALFKGVSLKGQGRPFGFGDGPEADWKAIFLSAVTLAILVTAVNVYIFLKIDKGEIFVIEPVSLEERSLNAVKLRETVLYYQGKARELENIKSGAVAPVVDPSL